jgi:hypothetical protein
MNFSETEIQLMSFSEIEIQSMRFSNKIWTQFMSVTIMGPTAESALLPSVSSSRFSWGSSTTPPGRRRGGCNHRGTQVSLLMEELWKKTSFSVFLKTVNHGSKGE